MAVKKTFVSQLIVMQTIDYAGEIRAWSTKVPELSLSNLLREALELGWPMVERRLRTVHGELTPAERWAGRAASVPAADRAAWIEDNPEPKSPRGRSARASTAA